MSNNNICCCLCTLCCYEPDSDNIGGETCSTFDACHAKTIEIILILGFSVSTISFLLSIIVGEWAKISNAIFFLFVALTLISAVGVLFSILLRYWRSDDSVLTTKYSLSLTISRFIFLVMSLSIACSIIQNIFISWAVDPNKASKVGVKRILFGFYNNDNKDKDEEKDDPKKSKQYSMAMFSLTYNEAALALMAFLTFHLIKRIKNRTVYGLSVQPHFIEQPNIEQMNLYYFNKYHSVYLAKKATELRITDYFNKKQLASKNKKGKNKKTTLPLIKDKNKIKITDNKKSESVKKSEYSRLMDSFGFNRRKYKNQFLY